MKKELLEAYMRLCTTQTNVFKGNVPKCHVFELTAVRSDKEPAPYQPYIYINAHCIPSSPEEPILKHWWIDNSDTPERIEEVLKEISDYIYFLV